MLFRSVPFIEQMSGYFPKEKDNLVLYYDIIEKIAQASSMHSLRYAENDIVVNTFYQTISINEVLEDLFQDKLLRDVLVGNLPLYAAEKDKTPFSQHAFIMDFYNQSAFRVVQSRLPLCSFLSFRPMPCRSTSSLPPGITIP